VKELPRLHPVAEPNVQKTLNVTAQPAEEVLKPVGQTLNLSGLGRQSENDALANQKLIANLILSERNIRRSHVIVEGVKCFRAAPSSPQRMPLRGQTSAANVDCSLVENKSIRVAENAHEVSRKLTKDLNILDALPFPSSAGNVHAALWRTLWLTDPAPMTPEMQLRRDRGIRCSQFVGHAQKLEFGREQEHKQTHDQNYQRNIIHLPADPE
jgi:hypothetical protein